MSPEITPGRRSGVFDVTAGETMIFSKFKEGRFPDHQEILDSLGKLGLGAS